MDNEKKRIPVECNVLVMGPSASGKTTSIVWENPETKEVRGLNPKTTAIINYECRSLPFKEQRLYKDEGNLVNIRREPITKERGGQLMTFTPYDQILMAQEHFYRKAGIEVIVHDSLTSMQEIIYSHCKNTLKIQQGYGMLDNAWADEVRELLNKSKQEKKINIWLSISELENDEFGRTVMSASSMRKGLKNKIEKEFTVVLCAENIRDESGVLQWNFITKNDGVHPAKAPRGMFEEDRIPNCLALVVERIQDYYNVNTID